VLGGARPPFMRGAPGSALSWRTLVPAAAPATIADDVRRFAGRGWRELRVPVATVVALIGLLLVLLGVRELFLGWRLRKPAVRVADLEWTGAPGMPAPSPAHLTASLRRELAELEFGAEDALPGRASGGAGVEILDAIGTVTPIARAFARVLPVVVPAAAYEVRGSARVGPNGRCEVIADVLSIAGSRRTLRSVVVREADWETAIRNTATAIAGALLPNLGRRRDDPWTHWRTPLPKVLLARYHAATRHRSASQLEEALAAYVGALACDPLNQALRLQVGETEEELELFLDAWASYRTIHAETRRSRRPWKARRTREHTWLLGRYRLAVLLGYGRAAAQWMRPESWDAEAGADVGAQADTEAGADARRSRRDEERQRLRGELARSLSNLDWLKPRPRWPVIIRRYTADRRAWRRWKDFEKDLVDKRLIGDDKKELVDKRLSGDTLLTVLCGPSHSWVFEVPEPGHEPRWKASELSKVNRRVPRSLLIEELLQIVALRELQALKQRLVLCAPWRLLTGRSHAPVSASSVAVTDDWIALRLARTRYFRTMHERAPDDATEHAGPADATDDAADDYRRAIERVITRWSLARLRARGVLDRIPVIRRSRWLVYYNAACTLSIALLPVPHVTEQTFEGEVKSIPMDDPSAATRALADAALACLLRFAHLAGSDRSRAHARWAVADDPDLAGLRQLPAFRDWAARNLGIAEERSIGVREVEVGIVTMRTLREAASGRAGVWRKRARTAQRSTRQELEWWSDDAAAWEGVATMCREYRSWRIRVRVVGQLCDSPGRGTDDRLHMTHGWHGPDDPYEELRMPPVELGDGRQEALLTPREIASVLRDHLQAIATEIQSHVLQPVEGERDRLQGLFDQDEQSPATGSDIRRARFSQARLWEQLASCLAADGPKSKPCLDALAPRSPRP
jgi:hypothetical protein